MAGGTARLTPSRLQRKPFGIYLHVPYCASKCLYCDFLSEPIDGFSTGQIQNFTKMLAAEAEFAREKYPEILTDRQVSTIYFGGGTPSLLQPAQIDSILASLEQTLHFSRQDCKEITLECNPLTAEIEKLTAFQQIGINRISLGIQSFNEPTLQVLSRCHNATQAIEACNRLNSLSLRSWSIDLIFAAPCKTDDTTQTPDNDIQRFATDIETALKFYPPHISIYGMTVHKGTPLAHSIHEKQLTLPTEEAQREMFLLARHKLTRHGYQHYEISNYALPGHRSRHNSLYWTNGEYLGLGPAAHSFFADVRYANPSDIQEWIQTLTTGQWPACPEDTPSPTSLRGERIMLALRRLDGVNIEEINHAISADFARLYHHELMTLTERQLIKWDGKTISLTEEGMLLSDSVYEMFF